MVEVEIRYSSNIKNYVAGHATQGENLYQKTFSAFAVNFVSLTFQANSLCRSTTPILRNDNLCLYECRKHFDPRC